MYTAASLCRKVVSYLYSFQLLIGMFCRLTAQNDSMKAPASRALVMSGMLWSIAARRILYPFVISCLV